MALELFNKKGGRYNNPSVTVTKAGQIGLNSACVEKYFKNISYVLLYGDKENNTIGIKPVGKNENNAFKISYSEKNATGAISGHSFLGYLGIDHKDKTKRYPVLWDDNQKMLIVKMQ